MGWFSSDSQSPKPKASSDGAFEAPDRTQRSQCWAARDAFNACLDKHNIIDSIGQKDKAAAHCGKEDQMFVQNCASSWVQYFKKRRVVEYKKEQQLKQLEAEGAKPM
ncbi:cytochrome oxidase c subunit VIb-domain-containing protein [Phyllosticta citrichinensis]|uniref:Cytochrome oxidase c subunit VIb-domain-containing protein n=1 Tax=Phyllosticta citrichinensis TaxID=1130410 RepID=A0ABR1Y2M0_9PEZI